MNKTSPCKTRAIDCPCASPLGCYAVNMKSTWLDICFPAKGSVPFDYEYALFSALNHEIGDIHNADWLKIHPIYGERTSNNISLDSRAFPLRIRVKNSHTHQILSLANRKLFVNCSPITIGEPTIFKIKHHNSLISRKVSFSGTKEEFQKEINEFLVKNNITSTINIGSQRKTFIKDNFVYGFEVKANDLSKEHSLFLQENGVFGKQRFGFGIFTRYVE